MEGGPPIFRQDFTCPALLEDPGPGFPYGAVTRSGAPFQTLRVPKTRAAGLFRVRSPLLAESRLMSVPPATEMFQFAGFASCTYGLSAGYPQELPLAGGLPHSEIPGSKIARISPGLFAACRVLHRLSVPRHPPDALDLRLILARHPEHNGIPDHPARAQRPAPPATPVWPCHARAASHEDTSPDPPPRHPRPDGAKPQRPSSSDRGRPASVTSQTLASPVNQHTPPDPQKGCRKR